MSTLLTQHDGRPADRYRWLVSCVCTSCGTRKAGSRRDFDGDDRDRPLSRAGREQAHGLTLMLGHLPISRIYSSPYVRCTQTVEPLAKKLGLELTITEALAEGEARPSTSRGDRARRQGAEATRCCAATAT